MHNAQYIIIDYVKQSIEFCIFHCTLVALGNGSSEDLDKFLIEKEADEDIATETTPDTDTDLTPTIGKNQVWNPTPVFVIYLFYL